MTQVSSSYVPLAYAYSSRYGAGRVSAPVSPSQFIYSQFEHVSGVAVRDGGTMSLDSLKILDILIDRLRNMKEEPLAAMEAPQGLSSGRIDALIQQYGSEIHAAAVAPLGPYALPVAAESGMLFSLAA